MSDFFEHYKKSEVTETRRVIHTPSDTAKRTFFYVQEAGYLKSLKSHLGKRSNLDSYLFLIVLSGSGTITYDGTDHHVSTQDCFLLDCSKEYSHISQPDDPWELLWVHFNGPQAETYYRYVIQKNGHCFQSIYLPSIVDTIYQLITIHTKVTEHSDLISSQFITNLLTMSVTGTHSEKEPHSDSKIKMPQILAYLDQNFSKPVTLDDLSAHFYISKYHLAREFKKEYNQTIIQYVLNKRINYGKELLRFTDLSIGEVAQACGIGDLNYFNKVFKRAEMMTASEYRRRW